MRLTCPACGAVTTLEAAANDKAARQVSVLFGELPPVVARVVPEYLALFRPAKQGLRWSRVATLLEELVPMVNCGFKKHGRRRVIHASIWQHAIVTVCDRELRRPLKNHNYLLEVVVDLADKAEGRWEIARDESLRNNKSTPEKPVSHQSEQHSDHEEALNYQCEMGFITPEERDRKIEEFKRLKG